MKRRILFVWLIGGLVLLLTSPAVQAGVAVELGLAQLATRSSAVVLGTAEESRSVWEESGGRRRIVTYHRVALERVVAGKQEGTDAWVRTLGGVVGEIGQRVEGEAVLPRGKRVMLFLTSRADGSSSVVGMAQGVWMVVKEADGAERVKPGLQRGVLVRNRERVSAQAELEGKTLDEVIAKVTHARASHGR